MLSAQPTVGWFEHRTAFYSVVLLALTMLPATASTERRVRRGRANAR